MAEQVDFYSFACPASAPFFGYFGAASAMALANLGAAYGTAKSGAGISGMGVSRPDLVMKALIPVVMAGVVGIYGLIIAVIISTKGKDSFWLRLHPVCTWMQIALLPSLPPEGVRLLRVTPRDRGASTAAAAGRDERGHGTSTNALEWWRGLVARRETSEVVGGIGYGSFCIVYVRRAILQPQHAAREDVRNVHRYRMAGL